MYARMPSLLVCSSHMAASIPLNCSDYHSDMYAYVCEYVWMVKRTRKKKHGITRNKCKRETVKIWFRAYVYCVSVYIYIYSIECVHVWMKLPLSLLYALVYTYVCVYYINVSFFSNNDGGVWVRNRNAIADTPRGIGRVRGRLHCIRMYLIFRCVWFSNAFAFLHCRKLNINMKCINHSFSFRSHSGHICSRKHVLFWFY